MSDHSKILYVTCQKCSYVNSVDVDASFPRNTCKICKTKLDTERVQDLQAMMPRGADGTLDLS
mgnify:CR=1 FL=1